ncbi:MAG: ATP-binding cassette domain-containing protein, partial [Pseudoxanthomonas sp.]
MTASTRVELSDLQVTTQGRTLLDGLSLQLQGGQCTGLVGESGSGKSLTSLALLNLLPAQLQAGATLRVEGEEIAFASPAHAALRGRMFGLVPQDPLAALHPLRKIGAQLIETLRVARGLSRDAARTEAEELLRRV